MSALRLTCGGWLIGLLLVGCGEGHGSGNANTSLEIPDAAGASISGNVSAGISAKDPSVLVLVMSVTPDNPEPFAPVGVGVVGRDGRFAVSDLPIGHSTVFFLRDDANDGVLDPNDTKARFKDTDGGLKFADGDRAELVDVQIDFASGVAVAGAVNVIRRDTEPTPTPELAAPTPTP